MSPTPNLKFVEPAVAPAPAATAPHMAITLDQAQQRAHELEQFVKNHLTPGVDYGLPANGKFGKKPSLYKAGAEKLLAAYGLAPMVRHIRPVEDFVGNFVSYRVTMDAADRASGANQASGVGFCNSREQRYQNQAAAHVANTVLKMSKKRALVDLALSATAASGIFTQDIEDLAADETPAVHTTLAPTPATQPAPPANAQSAIRNPQSCAPPTPRPVFQPAREVDQAKADNAPGAPKVATNPQSQTRNPQPDKRTPAELFFVWCKHNNYCVRNGQVQPGAIFAITMQSGIRDRQITEHNVEAMKDAVTAHYARNNS